VKKDRFKEIANNYSSKTEELNSLKKLANEYPFSQVVHLLLANASKKENPKAYKSTLSKAAFYSTDRSILKSLIETNLVPSELKTSHNVISPVKKPVEIKNKPNKVSVDTPLHVNTDNLIAQVLDNVNKLQKIKQDFADSFLENTPQASDKVESNSSSEKKKLKIPPPQKLAPKKNSSKKQTNLIEKFIKEKPSITQNSKPVNEKDDLSKESTKMRDDVVSESLAKIFARQGKTEKAIDIYKKLIWKLPQKKSLFAAEIEKLKKN